MQMTDNFSSFYRVSFRSTIIHPCSTTCSLKIAGRSFRYESPPSSLESTSVFRLISSAPSVIFFFTFLCTCHLVFIFIHHPLLLQSFTPGCPSTNNSRRRLTAGYTPELPSRITGLVFGLFVLIGLFYWFIFTRPPLLPAGGHCFWHDIRGSVCPSAVCVRLSK